MMNIFNSAIFTARILNLLCHRFIPARWSRPKPAEKLVTE